MKKNTILVLAMIAIIAIYILASKREEATTGNKAITLIKKAYPIYKDYPSDNLPQKSIEVVDSPDGWRVGMYVHGSGLPGILKANCFLVTQSGTITETGFFNGEGPAKDINLETCTPKE